MSSMSSSMRTQTVCRWPCCSVSVVSSPRLIIRSRVDLEDLHPGGGFVPGCSDHSDVLPVIPVFSQVSPEMVRGVRVASRWCYQRVQGSLGGAAGLVRCRP